MKLLSQYEEKLTTVPRWGIVRTINKQSVADHCFLVAIMAPRIAARYFQYSWTLNSDALFEITRLALLHDQHEAFTGDIPSPMKGAEGFDSHAIETSFADRVNETVSDDLDCKLVVKLADYLESMRFLMTEMQMGNGSVSAIYDHVLAKFTFYCDQQQISRDQQRDMLEEVLNWGEQQDPLDKLHDADPQPEIPF